ncbi:MAG: DUF1499 domain-containing protein [Alphaproteobacteria bacterium]|nr:DUF1499 domain-containing protein [Alphaproteobacteria bacterium]
MDDGKIIDFATLCLGPKPNQFLVAPSGLCPRAKPHLAAPQFHLPPERVRDAFLRVAAHEPRVRLTAEQASTLSYTFVQRSLVLHFPDIISVQFFPEGEGFSTLSAYSRSVHGYFDLGANAKRVKDWLAKVRSALAR